MFERSSRTLPTAESKTVETVTRTAEFTAFSWKSIGNACTSVWFVIQSKTSCKLYSA